MANNDKGHTRNRRSGSLTTEVSTDGRRDLNSLSGKNTLRDSRGKVIENPSISDVRRMVGASGLSRHFDKLDKEKKTLANSNKRGGSVTRSTGSTTRSASTTRRATSKKK